MKSFQKRSVEAEMMDSPAVPRELLHKNLRELDLLNRYTGGHADTMRGVKGLLTDRLKSYHIVDLGCGSGDTLKYLAHWALSNHFQFSLTGVDKNIFAIEYLKENCVDFPEIKGVAMDYKSYLQKAPTCDIVICNLFCHHLDNEALIELFQYLKLFAKSGFVINDLQRNPIAYYGAWFLTRLFNGSTLSKNDGPISVLRAFTRKEIKRLLRKAGLNNYTIHWKWAFRYLVVVKNN